MMCPYCGAEGVTTETVYDYWCSDAETTECSCEVCGCTWFDDTLRVTGNSSAS